VNEEGWLGFPLIEGVWGIYSLQSIVDEETDRGREVVGALVDRGALGFCTNLGQLSCCPSRHSDHIMCSFSGRGFSGNTCFNQNNVAVLTRKFH
jgi:hypothetical protein